MKEVIIMRGLPGSGKSTLAKRMLNTFKHDDPFALVDIYSTDDYFVHNGEYKFDGRKLTKAHEWNQARFRRALDNDYDLIIVDNTHTQFWELAPYIECAIDKEYAVKIVEPETPWRMNIDELLERNTHGVPRVAIENMINRWDSTESILSDVSEKYHVPVSISESTIYPKAYPLI